MEMYQVTMPKDDAWYIMNELGNLGVVQFMDLNKNEQPFSLTYALQIRKMWWSTQKTSVIIPTAFQISIMSYYSMLLVECKNFKVKLVKPRTVKGFLDNLNTYKTEKRKAENVLLDEVESDID